LETNSNIIEISRKECRGFPERSSPIKGCPQSKLKHDDAAKVIALGFGIISSAGPEHDPEKCEAVFRKDHAQSKSQNAMTIQPDLIAL
jgi:hypothetical protein